MSTLMNHLVRRYLKKWDRELNQIASEPWTVQLIQLNEILKSPFVKFLYPKYEHISDYETFTKEVEPCKYDDIKQNILRLQNFEKINCAYFAQSSGTASGEKKIIPTPERFVRKSHLRGSWYLLHTLYAHDKNMSVFTSKNLLIGGSIYQKTDRYTVGDISGIMLNRIPMFFRPWYVPSIATAVHPDWEYKIEKTAMAAARKTDITLLGGIPSWMLAVCQRILEITGAIHLTDLWPNLKAYIHGGVSFAPYINEFQSLIPKSDFRYIEVYNASEGFFAFQDRVQHEGMLLMAASGIFYEFIEIEKYRSGQLDVLNINQVKLGQTYVLLISSINGLLRYVQGDLISFVTKWPYRIKVVGRISEYINAFGEDLLLAHVEEALRRMHNTYDFAIRDFTIAPSYIGINNKGSHDWMIEFSRPPKNIEQFELSLDKALREINSNYDQKRTGNVALINLKIYSLDPGTINNYFERYGRVGGQSKLPKLKNDRSIAERLLREHHSSILQ